MSNRILSLLMYGATAYAVYELLTTNTTSAPSPPSSTQATSIHPETRLVLGPERKKEIELELAAFQAAQNKAQAEFLRGFSMPAKETLLQPTVSQEPATPDVPLAATPVPVA